MSFSNTSEQHMDPRFFGRSPLRSSSFLVSTLLLATVTALNVIILGRWWTRFPGFTQDYVILATIVMPTLWAFAWRDHSKIHELFESGELGQIAPGSPIDRILRVAVSMTFLGFFSTFFGIGAMAMALGYVVASR